MNIKTVKFLDKYIGSFLCSLLSIFNASNKKRFDDILIIQLWGIGETLLTLPAINAVRKKFPDSRINVLTTERVKDIFLLDEDIDNVISLKLNPPSIIKFILKNKKKFDLVIDFEEYLNVSSIISLFVGKYRIGFNHQKRSLLYNKRAEYNDQQHVVETCLDLIKLLDIKYDVKTRRNPKGAQKSKIFGTPEISEEISRGISCVPEMQSISVKLIKIDVPEKDKKFVNDLLKKNNIIKKDFIVGIAPGAAESAKSRMWPKENFAKISDILIERYNFKIIFIGNKNEINLIEKIQNLMKNKSINLAGKTDLKQLFYLIERCSLVISNDTGPMHISAAQQVKTIGLFGPNLPVRWGPYGQNNISIYGEVECSPCINVHKGEVPECRWHGKDYQKCMKKVTVEDVLNAVEKIIK